jgi:succinate dehydrogenase/fumarate reductase flavoprotein subunit
MNETKRKHHWLDATAQELWEEMHGEVQELKGALAGDTPLGTVEQYPEEQLSDFVSMSRDEHEALRQQVGDEEYSTYVQEMQALMVKKFGPMAEFVMPYLMEGQ